MEPVTIPELIAATHATLVGSVPEGLTVTQVSYDTRTLSEGDLFLPLKGERTDGHRYIHQAVHAGAAGSFTMEDPIDLPEGKFLLHVKDTAAVPRQLAAWYKTKFPIPFVAVTGSVGKTTTKDMTAAVLSEKFTVHKTPKNHNNTLGVPMAILDITARDQVSVIEMGMNHFGEIDQLSDLVRPQIAVITNIGDAHIENLGSREGILKAKCEVFAHMAPDAPAVLNGDDPLLRSLKGKLSRPVFLCGTTPDCDYYVSDMDRDLVTEDLSCKLHTPKTTVDLVIPNLVADYMVYPILSAAAVGEYLGMTGEEIARGILRYAPSKMRMNVVDRGRDIRILDDAYNANPQSMRAGIQTLSAARQDYKIAILGDMLELGSMAPGMHAMIGSLLAECNIQCLVAIGELARYIADGAGEAQVPEVYWFATKQEALPTIAKTVQPGCAILVKASRRMEFEEIVNYLVSITPDKEDG